MSDMSYQMLTSVEMDHAIYPLRSNSVTKIHFCKVFSKNEVQMQYINRYL